MNLSTNRPIASIALLITGIAAAIATACTAPAPAAPTVAAPAAAAKAPALQPPAVLTAGQIECSGDFGAPPNQFQDPNGKEQGINPDIMRGIGQELGATLKFDNLPFGSQIAGLQAKRYDAMCTSAIVNPDRLMVMYMIPYVQWGRALLVRADDASAITCTAGDFDPCVAKLSGKTVLTGAGSIENTDLKTWSDTFVAAGKPPITIQTFENQGQAAAALARGVGDVSYHEDPQVAYFMQQFPNKFKIVMQKYMVAPVSLTTRKEPEAIPLADAIVWALERMKADGTYQSILQTWNLTAADSFQYQK